MNKFNKLLFLIAFVFSVIIIPSDLGDDSDCGSDSEDVHYDEIIESRKKTKIEKLLSGEFVTNKLRLKLLNKAIQLDKFNMVKFIISLLPPKDKVEILNMREIYITPLGVAMRHAIGRHYNYNIIKYLIEGGADVNLEIRLDWTQSLPLQIAVRKKWLPLVRLLLEKGANVNKSIYDNSALDIALLFLFKRLLIKKDEMEIIKILLNNGGKIQNLDKVSEHRDGRTLLMQSAIKNFPFLVNYLLHSNANTTLRDHYGKTFYDYAKGKPAIQNEIKKHKELIKKQLPEKIPAELKGIIAEYYQN